MADAFDSEDDDLFQEFITPPLNAAFDSEDDDMFREFITPPLNAAISSTTCDQRQEEEVTNVPGTPASTVTIVNPRHPIHPLGPLNSKEALLNHQEANDDDVSIVPETPITSQTKDRIALELFSSCSDELITTVPETPASVSNLLPTPPQRMQLKRKLNNAEDSEDKENQAKIRRVSKWDKFTDKVDDGVGAKKVLSVKDVLKTLKVMQEEEDKAPNISEFAREGLKKFLKISETDYPILTSSWVKEYAKKIPVGYKIPMLLLTFKEGLMFDVEGNKKPWTNCAKLYDDTGSIDCTFDNEFLKAYAHISNEGTTMVLVNCITFRMRNVTYVGISKKNITHIAVDTDDPGREIDLSNVSCLSSNEFPDATVLTLATLDTEQAKREYMNLSRVLKPKKSSKAKTSKAP